MEGVHEGGEMDIGEEGKGITCTVEMLIIAIMVGFNKGRSGVKGEEGAGGLIIQEEV